jgi:beta-glucosidase
VTVPSDPAEPRGNLTIEQQAALVVGAGFWDSVAVPELGIPSIVIADGPHGVRLAGGGPGGAGHLGLGDSAPATCFPPAAGLASSWNVDLVERVGRALGDEARALGVDVLLGPGVNIKRSPLCGRNFEYFSEDPLVSGELGAAWVRGLQSRGVGASLKHFAANNQETNRMTVSAEVDERTLREIYLPAFERIVVREQPWTVMCAYNRVNGIPAAEHRWLLTDVLRDEWGFEGAVISDWGAVDDIVPAIAAGLDLEMPGPQAESTASLVAAVRDRSLPASALADAAARVRHLAQRTLAARGQQAAAPARTAGANAAAAGPGTWTATGSIAVHAVSHAVLAREAATQSMVLLRNEPVGSGQRVLPLATNQRIAVIGEFARTPRIQGAGSSQVTPTRVDSALDALSAVSPVEFAPGYAFDRRVEPEPLIAQAVAIAARSDAVLLFAGLPDGDESEGYDRAHLHLPPAQVELIRRVAEVNDRVTVILTNGGVVSLEPWHDSVAGILEAWLLGQAGGAAIADVVFGRVSPSGRLAESIPFRLEDTPSFLNFPGEGDVVRYGEGVFVGYRYYETADVRVRYPFGFGLTYTEFEYSDLEIRSVASPGDAVAVTITNTGTRAGSEVAQLYVGAPAGGALRTPRRELRAFARVTLEAGESLRVELALDDRAYAHWHTDTGEWVIEGGEHTIEVGRSASDIVLSGTVRMPQPKPGRLTLESSVAEFLAHPVTGPILLRTAQKQGAEEGGTAMFDMVGSMPMRRLLRYPGTEGSRADIVRLMRLANIPVVRTVASWFRRRT